MKKLLVLLSFAGFTSCGNGGSTESSNTDSVTVDTSFSGHVIADSATTNAMNADTTGIGNAR